MHAIVEKIFTYPPIFNAARRAARKQIMERGHELGLDFSIDTHSHDWDTAVRECTRDSVKTPQYYNVPFHAYQDGNMSIDAALEVTNAAKSVHATVFSTDDCQKVDPDGDARLRRSYSACIKTLLSEEQACQDGIRQILDIGAATGLSSMELIHAFDPTGERNVRIVGIDLSPYFVAVGRYMLHDVIETGRVTLEHGVGEDIEYDDEHFDMVSMCLVCHEVPQEATKRIFKEAYRVLRPGGALCIMEMDPTAPAFQKVMSNPIPYVVFKSTEPYLLEYCNLDMHEALIFAGFSRIAQMTNSPRHKTVVAIKE